MARVARFGEAMCFGDLAGFDELFDEPLKTSDSQPASLTSIGSSTNAAIAATMVRRRGRAPEPDLASFCLDNGNCYSAAAVRGRPTKPVASPKRSTMTADSSLALLVTQAPERTA